MLQNLFDLRCPIPRVRNPSFALLLLLGMGHMEMGRTQYTRPRSQISIGLGIPRHPDMDLDKNGFLVSVNYRRNTNRLLNWGLVLLRASASSELDFFGDSARLMDYLNNKAPSLGIGTTWSGITTFASGAQLHFNIVSNKDHLFSISGGLGLYRSASTSQGLGMVTRETLYSREGEPLQTRITALKGVLERETRTEPFFLPALYYQYAPGGSFFIGIEAVLLLDLDAEPLTTHPVLANFYSFNLHFGRRF